VRAVSRLVRTRSVRGSAGHGPAVAVHAPSPPDRTRSSTCSSGAGRRAALRSPAVS